jgi:pimeloyl-ACP methyl ester carboxylesterase
LTDFQQAMRDPRTSQTTAAAVTASQLTKTFLRPLFTPPLHDDDPETAALTDILAYGSGLAVLPATIKYLDERAQAEVGWLESLHESFIPTTLIWGIHDTVAPIRVANYVWATYLRSRAAPSAYRVLPGANHYAQHDQPAALAHLVRLSLTEHIRTDPMNLTNEPSAPVLVERGELPHHGSAP